MWNMRSRRFGIHTLDIDVWNISSIGKIMVLTNEPGNLHPTARMHQTKFKSFITNILLTRDDWPIKRLILRFVNDMN
jgi:hypothetical protein